MVPNRENGLNKDSCCMYLIVFAPPDKTRAPKKMEVWGIGDTMYIFEKQHYKANDGRLTILLRFCIFQCPESNIFRPKIEGQLLSH